MEAASLLESKVLMLILIVLKLNAIQIQECGQVGLMMAMIDSYINYEGKVICEQDTALQ